MKKIEPPAGAVYAPKSCRAAVDSANKFWLDWFNENLADCYVLREDELVRVYGSEEDGLWRSWDEQPSTQDTHQAYLIGIEPIKKCEHEKYISLTIFNPEDRETKDVWAECEKCGAKLKPTSWTEVE